METIYTVKIDGVPAYVGTTKQTVEQRLKDHLQSSTTGTSKWYQVLRASLLLGCEVTIEALEDNAEPDREWVWHQILEFQGYALANTKEGNKGAVIDEGKLKKEIAEWKRSKRKRKAVSTPIPTDFNPVAVQAEYERLRDEMKRNGEW